MPNLDLSVPDAAAGKGTGTEVRIPGVGTLGVLPKLDFGLELLYGANEPPVGRPDDRSAALGRADPRHDQASVLISVDRLRRTCCRCAEQDLHCARRHVGGVDHSASRSARSP